MEPNKLTFTVDRLTGRERLTQACESRMDRMTRHAIVDALNLHCTAFVTPYDSCFTTGELARELVKLGVWSRV